MTSKTKKTLLTIGAIYIGWKLLMPRSGGVSGKRIPRREDGTMIRDIWDYVLYENPQLKDEYQQWLKKKYGSDQKEWRPFYSDTRNLSKFLRSEHSEMF